MTKKTYSKTTMILAVLGASLVITMWADSILLTNARYTEKEYLSLSHLGIWLFSSTLFVRGIFGWFQDRQDKKRFKTVFMGYHTGQKEAIQLMNEEQKTALEHVDDSETVKKEFAFISKIKKYTIGLLLAVVAIVFVTELLGITTNDYRATATWSQVFVRGVTLWGDNETIYTLLSLAEIIIQFFFVMIFARGAVGYYHDTLLSMRERTTIVFGDVALPKLDNHTKGLVKFVVKMFYKGQYLMTKKSKSENIETTKSDIVDVVNTEDTSNLNANTNAQAETENQDDVNAKATTANADNTTNNSENQSQSN
ncbi:hypothetical protein [Lonepinella sp. BR2271]|uniref:hypothetical protein n=1 Tax=Lonepinella sp. BR2271 TaxID=3434550 RepID=UPI003F6DEEBD